MADFPRGIRVFKPHTNAPDFVIATLSITKQELINWLNDDAVENKKGYVDLQILKSRDGKWYTQVNNFEPTSQAKNTKQPTQPMDVAENLTDDDLPF